MMSCTARNQKPFGFSHLFPARVARSCVAVVAFAGSVGMGAVEVPTTSPSTTRAAPGRVPSTRPAMVLTGEPVVAREISNNVLWHDVDGTHINAHGGGVLFHEGTYYWFGEHRAAREPGRPRAPMPGVACYTSTDLYNWKPQGIVMPVVEGDEAHDIARGCTIERPKVVFNAKTGKFVMWFHLELRGRGYGAARTAVAVADRPVGPYRYVRSFRPNANKWPVDFPDDLRTVVAREDVEGMMKGLGRRRAIGDGAFLRRDFEAGQMARDMTLFVDPDDGKAYLVASAEENLTLHVHELTDDFLDFTGKWTRIQPGGHNEAPAIIKHEGKYHMLASGCTGWAPNDARSLVADSMWGPWTTNGNPCFGTNPLNDFGPELTFGGQSTFILPIPGKPGAYVAMFDVWRPPNLIESGYVWLPLTVENGRMHVRWRDRWDVSAFDR